MVATFTLLFALVVAPLTYFLVEHAREAADQQNAVAFQRDAALIATALEGRITAGDSTAALERQLAAFAAESEYALAVLDEGGSMLIVALPPDDPGLELLPPAAVDQLSEPAVVEEGFWAYATAPLPQDRVLLARTQAASLDTDLRGLWPRAIAGMAIALGIVAGLSWGVARRISAPLESLRSQAAQVAAGDLSASVDPHGPRDIRELAVAFNTMTERVRTLVEESGDARRRLEMIFENLREGVLVVDAEEMVIAENRRARQMLGSLESAGVGSPFAVVVRDHDLVDQLRRSRSAAVPSTAPIAYARSGRAIEATVIPVIGERETFSVVVLRDVTDIRRLESIRREFVANVSHELRTPLASIRALADTLESGALDDPAVAIDFVRRIIGEVDRLNALVEELLELGRAESGRLGLNREPVDPAVIVHSGVDRLRPQIERAGLSIDITLPDGLPLVVADRDRIERVIINLLHNAIKFTPAGGTISLSARETGEWVQFDIADTGQGIATEELPRVFERFYKADRSRRSDGAGLGLAIAKHVVLAHGGEIWAGSEPGKGSTFSFTLPAADSRQETAAPR
jgi:two-component system phosphate regulon sensor histidine kinase PhoR